MLALALVVLIAAPSPADDISGVWVGAQGPKEDASPRTLVVGKGPDGKWRAVWNRHWVYELVRKGDAYEPAAAPEGKPMPTLYALDGKTLGVGKKETVYTRTPKVLLDAALRALQDPKLTFTSVQTKKATASLWGGMFLAADTGKRCVFGVLVPPAREEAPAGKPGKAVRATPVSWLEAGELDCGSPLPAAFTIGGNNGGVFLLTDPVGKPLGVELVGYMYADAFLREGTTEAQAKEILDAANAELGKQAE